MTPSSREAGVAGTMSRRELLLAGPLICAPSLCWAATPPSAWRMWIEQGGVKTEITPDVRLQRQPFTLVFEGPRDWAYTVLACENRADVAGKDPLAFLTTSTNPAMAFAQSADPAESNYLCVNGAGLIGTYHFGMHIWADEPDVNEHDFTRFTEESPGIAKAERDVMSIVLNTAEDSSEDVPVANTTIATISFIVAANKPVGYLDFTDPLSFTITFA